MNAALIGNEERIADVYGGGRLDRIAAEFDLVPGVLTAQTVRERQSELREVQFLFSTWGMPALGADEIALMPSLAAVCYAAGSVQRFARPFLDAGVTVISAWAANAVPVAEYAVAQILLCNKGFFPASRAARSPETRKTHDKTKFPGNFDTTVALLGAGMIGRAVVERLRPYALELIVFDPFLSDEDARALGVEKVSLDAAFRRGFVVSNHLANLPETVGMLGGEHFKSMQANASFINTGRGATVDEPAMIAVLQQRSDLTAVLDVTSPEPPVPDSALYGLENVVLTPHIAGSMAGEVRRMADTMIEEAVALRERKPLRYEVTLEMLETMA